MFSAFLPKGKNFYLNDRHEEADTASEDRRKLYDKRILPLLRENDAAIFAEEISPFLWNYYQNLGLATIKKENIFYVPDYLSYPSLTKAVLNNQSLIKKIKQRNFDMLIPYIESYDTQVLAQKIGCQILRNAYLTDWINNKTNYRQIIKELGFPMIPGSTAKSLEEAQKYFRSLKNQGFKEIVLKKERSVSGFGVFVIKTEKELKDQLEKTFINQKQFLLEGFIEKTKISPNVQYWVGPRKIDLIIVSDQLLEKDRVSYAGNVFSSQLKRMPHIWKKIENLSLKFCDYLQKQKCYGLIGIDYLVTRDGHIYSTEANVRINGSTFAALIIKNLFRPSDKIFWKTFSLHRSPLSFKKLFECSSESFITQRGQFGIFPIGVDLLDSMGEGQFMAVGKTLEEVNQYIKKL
ncbi:MAG: ATP-grasp domain-containing protein [Candidatus Portnoybacteria bacterium]|nr:ATP-grasp domain-containing protein [Candidatus Portnoybacteria bacterium]